MRGHNAIPKKGLLRELCHRGLTFLLDEHKTSKVCPCGHDELKTTGYRFRAHKSDGAVYSLLTRLGARSCDRDGDTKGVATGPSGPSVGVAQRGVVRAVRTFQSYATGAPLQEQMHALRVRKTSFWSDKINETDRYRMAL